MTERPGPVNTISCHQGANDAEELAVWLSEHVLPKGHADE